MPSLSSLFKHGKPASAPCLTFYGPDPQNHFTAVGTNGQPVAHFAVASSTIWRNAQQICTFKLSSLSGTTTLRLQGHEIKMKQSWEGLRYGKDIKSQFGSWKWRPGSGGFEELTDARGTLLARGKLPGTLSKKVHPLEVFVPGDEFTLDLVFSSWVAMLDCRGAEDEQTEAVAEVVGALAGS